MDYKTELVRKTLDLGRKAARSEKGRKALAAARVVVQSGPVTEVARLCGRAGMAGAIVDGGMGVMQAAGAVREGRLDTGGAAKHVAAEAGCGFVTSASGTAGTVAVYMVTGTMGPAALALGMGASMGSRWAYRKLIGETLPMTAAEAPDGGEVDREEEQDNTTEGMEEIGPKSRE